MTGEGGTGLSGAMNPATQSHLPLWAPLVLAHAKDTLRPALEALLALDGEMARVRKTVSEPALAQVRMAWWRAELERDRDEGASLPPDPLLRALLQSWGTRRGDLVALVDGWEHLLADQPWEPGEQEAFCDGRGKAFAGLAHIAGQPEYGDAAKSHGMCWAQADLAKAAGGVEAPAPALPKLPRSLRPLAIIGGLSRRAIARGGQPIFGDRLSPLAAMKLGIFGT